MPYKRVLTVQDISCVGQCSMTVALPVLSACGVETCVLPSAVLSTHTGGFSGMTVRDLTEDIPAIRQHWEKEGISFDGIYTGYLGSIRQIGMVKDLFDRTLAPGGVRIVDPAMADHGKLYKGFDGAYALAMRDLCARADIILPNITEACMMTGTPYREELSTQQIERLLASLGQMGAGCVVLTGVGGQPGMTGATVYANGKTEYYCHEKIPKNYHGTGDLFAAAFVGAYVQGRTPIQAVKIAADYTSLCIRKTYDDPAHWYGVKFETALPDLIKMLEE